MLGPDDVDAVIGMLTNGDESGELNKVEDWDRVAELLSHLGVPEGESLVERLKHLANHWLRQAASAGHPPGCQDQFCTASRKIVRF